MRSRGAPSHREDRRDLVAGRLPAPGQARKVVRWARSADCSFQLRWSRPLGWSEQAGAESPEDTVSRGRKAPPAWTRRRAGGR